MNKRIICLWGGPGTGKCLEKDTEIIMYSGMIKRAKDVNIGEQIMGPDSLPRTVAEKCTGLERLYRITMNNGDFIDVTANHILPLVHSGKKNSRHDGDEFLFTVQQYINLPISWREKLKLRFTNAIEYKEKAIPLDPYLVGAWLGDGTKDSTSICGADSEVFDKIDLIVSKYNCFLSKHYYKPGKCIDYYIVSNDKQYNYVRRQLKELNLWNNKHIPQNYIINSLENRLALLAGLIDTDGHFSIASKAYDICTKYEHMARQIKFIAQSCGFYSKIAEKCNCDQCGTYGTYYTISIAGDNLDRIPCQIARKKAIKRIINKDPLRSGFTINEIGVGEYVGLTIDDKSPNKLFLTKDHIVTHNSTTSAEIFSILKKLDYNTELVREYIKDWVWEKRELIPGDQVYISAKQARKERMYIRSGLDYIVSDSPLGLCTLYGSIYDKYEQENNACLAMLRQHHSFCKDHGYKTDHFFLQRTKKYNPEGRFQKNEEEAIEIDKKILTFLNEQGFHYQSVVCDNECAQNIVNIVLSFQEKK